MNDQMYLFLIVPLMVFGMLVVSASTINTEFGQNCRDNYIPLFCDKAIEHLEELEFKECNMVWVKNSTSQTTIYKPLYKCLKDNKTKEQCMGTGYEELRDIYGC